METTQKEIYKDNALSGPVDIDQAMICYCFRLTAGQLKSAYQECGSLEQLQCKTKAGTGCNGCRVILHSMFGEQPKTRVEETRPFKFGSGCSQPGTKVMKAFVLANEQLNSRIVSTNAVAPQLGDCDAGTEIEYALLDHRGQPLLINKDYIKTNETFTFDTANLDVPRPFYGVFLLALGRSNFGAARFNVQWYSNKSISSTHENSSTGRLRVFLPFFATPELLKGTNEVYLATMNPHENPACFKIQVFDPDQPSKCVTWQSYLAPHNATWINATEYLYRPAMCSLNTNKLALKIESNDLSNIHTALTTYFFFHNVKENLWSVQHL